MQITGIKRGKTIELPEELDLPDGEAIDIEICEDNLDRKEGGGFWDSVLEFRQKYNIAELDIDPDEIFKDVRDRSPGQEDDGVGFGQAVLQFREDENIEEADIDPDEVFKDVRDRSPGRDIVL